MAATEHRRVFIEAVLVFVLLVTGSCKVLQGAAPPAPLVSKPVRPWDDLFDVAVRGSSKEVYAVGSDGLLLTSTDAGKTWRRRHLNEQRRGSPLFQDLDLYAIQFDPSGESGWIVGEQGIILHSSDAGKTWKLEPSPCHERLLSVAALSPQVVCAVGNHGAIIQSLDAGRTWTYQKVNDLTFYKVGFINDHEGWLVGEFETVMHSSDRGKTWEVQRGGTLANFTVPPYFAIAAKDAQHVLVAGQSGVFAISNDGGKTWAEGRLEIDQSVYAAAGPVGQFGMLWLAGAQGSIFTGALGEKWNFENPTVQDLTGIAATRDFSVAVGLGGTIVRTDSQGSWRWKTE